jgi:hypothetical protein
MLFGKIISVYCENNTEPIMHLMHTLTTVLQRVKGKAIPVTGHEGP